MKSTKLAMQILGECMKLSRSVGYNFNYGVVLESDHTPNGEPAWSMTTQGGEQLWLTCGMLRAVEKTHWWLQGGTPAQISNWHSGCPEDELASDLHLLEYHMPAPGMAGAPFLTTSQGRYELGRILPLVLLTERRPDGWPV